MIGRILGWAVFGTLIGLSEGLAGRSQVWKGMLGGFLGGALGGLLLDRLQVALSSSLLGKVLGLVLLGALVVLLEIGLGDVLLLIGEMLEALERVVERLVVEVGSTRFFLT